MGQPGKTLQCIFDSATSGNLATGNTNLISMPFNLADMQTASVQIISDGGAKVNYMFQVTNIPLSITEYNKTILGKPARDDSYTSPMWSTISTSGFVNSTTPSTIITLAVSCHADGRLLLSWDSGNSAGTSAYVFASVKTIGYYR